ncbi:MAG: riboflavin biosynthesis protein RibF [Elusimicrobium sp.]|jgi:riboflavin kinase/FMN adenylyltransferase|nr:riboflavin biosynthesis protein RibF [Elusimicrobium sp.]
MKNFITIGGFDGVHTGHVKLILRLKKLARAAKMNSVVLYFQFPPKAYISGGARLSILTLPGEKFALLSSLETGVTRPLNFKRIRFLSRENFFDLLLKTYKMGGLLVGRDFAFGRGRKGHIDFLRAACKRAGVKLEIEDFFKTEDAAAGRKVSSSLIRKMLADGEIEKANKLLGYKYSVGGTVIEGKKLGRTLGFPTANMDTGFYKVLPRGIFAVEVIVGKEKFKGVANIGFRPTVNPIYGDVPLVETHILDFNRDIYGQIIRINFVSKIRGEKKFKTLPALVRQIRLDAKAARRLVKI